jgi:hypothetical protein
VPAAYLLRQHDVCLKVPARSGIDEAVVDPSPPAVASPSGHPSDKFAIGDEVNRIAKPAARGSGAVGARCASAGVVKALVARARDVLVAARCRGTNTNAAKAGVVVGGGNVVVAGGTVRYGICRELIPGRTSPHSLGNNRRTFPHTEDVAAVHKVAVVPCTGAHHRVRTRYSQRKKSKH